MVGQHHPERFSFLGSADWLTVHRLLAGLIGLLLFCCLILSQPFRGPIAITPEAFEKTILILDDVDRGN